MAKTEICAHCDCVITRDEEEGSLWKNLQGFDTCPARRGKHRYWNHEPVTGDVYGDLKATALASRLLGTYKHKDMIRGFYHLCEAWYADANLKNRTDGLLDEVTIGFFGRDGDAGTTGEFGVRWKELGDGKVHPRLEVFDDGWEALAHFSDLLAEMVKLDNTDPTPQQFCKLLKRLGIKDLTPRTHP